MARTLEASLFLFSPSTPQNNTFNLNPSLLKLPILPSLKSYPPTIKLRFYTREVCPRRSFRPCLSVQEMGVDVDETTTAETQEEEGQQTANRKLYVSNLPWSVTADDIKSLFEQYGTVKDVEIIKQKNGLSRGFAFVTMASGEDTQAAIDKLNSYELSGRIIRVEYAKRFKKPSPTATPPPPSTTPSNPPRKETIHKLYVSNLAWKARSTHLRELFSEKFKPVSSRVVFESPSGRSAGYGFISFSTREEADAAMSEFDGKELMGRPLRLKFSARSEASSGKEEETISDDSQPKTS